MENTKAIIQAKARTSDSLDTFKQGVDRLLSKRQYFISQVLPELQEGQDYYVIKGKKSLAKGGAEKLASIYSLIATFQKDDESLDMLGNVKGTVAFVCTLSRFGMVAGQGRGADTMARNGNDPNKTLKLAQKRAYTDAVIRATGLSDIFTQDLEDMESDHIPEEETPGNYEPWTDNSEKASKSAGETYPDSGSLITEKQKKLLVSLANEKCDEEEREMILESADSMDKSEASHLIREILNR